METHEWEMINRLVMSGAVTIVPAGDHIPPFQPDIDTLFPNFY